MAALIERVKVTAFDLADLRDLASVFSSDLVYSELIGFESAAMRLYCLSGSML